MEVYRLKENGDTEKGVSVLQSLAEHGSMRLQAISGHPRFNSLLTGASGVQFVAAETPADLRYEHMKEVML